jgi:hypothetical protein
MYTTIPLTDLAVRIKSVCREAWTDAADQLGVHSDKLLLNWNRGDPDWLPGNTGCHSKYTHKFTLWEVGFLTEFVVTNTYVMNGSILRKQAIGIPMGTNCAPAVANLYLYSYESEYIDRLTRSNEVEKAQAFHLSFRLIDDVLSFDNPYWNDAVGTPAEDGGLYPKALKLTDTSISPVEVNYIGMKIMDGEKGLQLEVYDKRKEFNFPVIRYPNLLSLIPASSPYGVWMGQLHRFYRISTHPKSFLTSAAILALTLLNQGCVRNKLELVFHHFLSSKGKLHWKTKLSDLTKSFRALLRNEDMKISVVELGERDRDEVEETMTGGSLT